MATKQLDLSLDGPNTLFLPEEQNNVKSMARFWMERHRIFLRKQMGKEKPWTEDTYLRQYRFCNIYRELDTVSLWIWENVIKPNETNPNLPVLVALSRLINWPDTIQHLIDNGVWPTEEFNKRRFYESLLERKEEGHKVVTGAYIVNTVFPKDFKKRDGSKVGYITDIAATDLWKNRQVLARAGKTTMEEFVSTLRKLHGWGSFMAYQTVVDLSYSKKWLAKASDLNTFISPGPGTVRGLNRVLFGSKKVELSAKKITNELVDLRSNVNKVTKQLVPSKLWTGDYNTGFQELTLSNVHNLCCEYDKYCRLIGHEGEPRSRYSGN